MTSRERATVFILSPPKLEGFQVPSEQEPEKFKIYRQLIDRLEGEIKSHLREHRETVLRRYENVSGEEPFDRELAKHKALLSVKRI